MYFGCLFAPFLDAFGGILEGKRRSNNRVKFWMCFRSRFWIFLGSIFDQSLVLENHYFVDEKMLNFASKNGGKLGSQKAPPKFHPPGPFRDPPDPGRSWPLLVPPRRLLGLIWQPLSLPWAPRGPALASLWVPLGSLWLLLASRSLPYACPWPDL